MIERHLAQARLPLKRGSATSQISASSWSVLGVTDMTPPRPQSCSPVLKTCSVCTALTVTASRGTRGARV